MHRPMTQIEIKELLGKEVIKKVKVTNHNWIDNNQLVDMGITKLGAPIKVNHLEFAEKIYRINLSEKVDILFTDTGTWTTWYLGCGKYIICC